MKRSIFRSLYFQVVVALIAGIAVGHFYPAIATDMKPIGDAFINGIKMVITPVVFCTIVSGIAGMESLKKVGRVGGKAVLYFEVVTTLALIIGMIVANVVQPGAGINADIASLDKGAVAAIADKAHPQTTIQFITAIVPNSVIDSFAKKIGVPTPLFSATQPVYDAALKGGHGEHDTAAVCAVLEAEAGVKRRKRAAAR